MDLSKNDVTQKPREGQIRRDEVQWTAMSISFKHINSIRRESLGGRSPWQVASEDEDMRVLMNLLNMKEIESDNVLLTPDLLDD